MIDAPDWFVYAFDLVVFVGAFLLLLYLKAWWNVRKFKGKNAMKMYAEIWEPSGRRPKHLVEPDPDGATVTVKNLVYRLPSEKSEKEIAEAMKEGKPASGSHIYPRRCWMEIPNWPLPSIPVRVESWELDNPEPIRPFYGRVDEDGKFLDSQLTVTSSEWAAHRSKITAIGIAQDANERAAREKEWLKSMTNMPNKMLIYVGLGALLILAVINLFMIYQG
jgi:hypothetical protein